MKSVKRKMVVGGEDDSRCLAAYIKIALDHRDPQVDPVPAVRSLWRWYGVGLAGNGQLYDHPQSYPRTPRGKHVHLNLLAFLACFFTMDAFSSIVDTSATSLYISVLSIAFNPTAWNIVARNGTHRPFLRPH